MRAESSIAFELWHFSVSHNSVPCAAGSIIFPPEYLSFNHQNTYAWYRERIYKLEGEQEYDATDRMAAFAKALEWGERIPIGVLYRKDRPVYEEQLKALKQMPLVKQALDPLQFEELLKELL